MHPIFEFSQRDSLIRAKSPKKNVMCNQPEREAGGAETGGGGGRDYLEGEGGRDFKKWEELRRRNGLLGQELVCVCLHTHTHTYDSREDGSTLVAHADAQEAV